MELLKLSVTIPPLRRFRYKVRNFIRYTLPEMALICGLAGVLIQVWMYFFVW